MKLHEIFLANALLKERAAFRHVLLDDGAAFRIEGQGLGGEPVSVPCLEANARIFLYRRLKEIEDEMERIGVEFDHTNEQEALKHSKQRRR